MRVVFVHGACVRDGAWWWRPTGELLRAAGVQSVAAALPSCGEGAAAAGAAGPGLAEDVAAVRELLAAKDEPTVVVAHSYGGIVTAQAAVGVDAVRHVLLISSYLAEAGESLSSFGGEEPAPFLEIDPEAGTFGVRPELFAGTFMHDCGALAEEGAARLARQSVQVVGQPVEAAVWGAVPTSYLVCAQDRGTPAERQREFARRADHVAEVGAGHHPFLSQPAFVRDLVLGLA
ncbi:alpha/beta hydrolase [Conexibacter sp. JD483]|uniref:alpha/beta fold hydrolase n=1 Tax=unclassified Conexibacter TaxID=2627773 RepID=UPI002728D1CC|nr:MULTISPECIES: alpha/beta hydrolase [unclassified Conexibacter]MDO8189409.1 alpha/beta hydrolase [Conexibacter sp. CPCC 205706]MDO8202018.1 alpha/beta hydrolase [Conexibacter sp. CPCC 205762]MDR9372481.1 alpha/beta hydrolase [Conexibacter sp. JD483]